MKPSGIEWIGDIPDDWKVCRLKGLGEQIIGLTYSPADLTDSSGTIVLRSSNIQNGRLILDRDDNVYVSIDVGSKIIKNDDILICSRNGSKHLIGKNAYIKNCDQKLSFGAFTTVLRSDYNRFLFFVFNSGIFEYYLASYSTSTINQLTTTMLNEIKVPFPNIETQQKIADYLDEKCDEIDKTIEKQKESIEKLKTYKQSLISETVTKGLNKSTPLKPSEIDYLGDIPTHWEVKRVKYVANSFEKGNGITKDDVIFDGDIQCVRYGEIYSKYDRQCIESVSDTNIDKIKSPVHISKGDILFAGTGELIEEIGKNIVYMGDKPCLAGGDIIILKHNQNPIFLNYALNSTSSQSQKSYGKLKLKVVHISASAIGNIRIALPPITEQNKIAEFLDRKCSEIDSTINKKQNLIEKLDAYKKSLIFECVTGKRTI